MHYFSRYIKPLLLTLLGLIFLEAMADKSLVPESSLPLKNSTKSKRNDGSILSSSGSFSIRESSHGGSGKSSGELIKRPTYARAALTKDANAYRGGYSRPFKLRSGRKIYYKPSYSDPEEFRRPVSQRRKSLTGDYSLPVRMLPAQQFHSPTSSSIRARILSTSEGALRQVSKQTYINYDNMLMTTDTSVPHSTKRTFAWEDTRHLNALTQEDRLHSIEEKNFLAKEHEEEEGKEKREIPAVEPLDSVQVSPKKQTQENFISVVQPKAFVFVYPKDKEKQKGLSEELVNDVEIGETKVDALPVQKGESQQGKEVEKKPIPEVKALECAHEDEPDPAYEPRRDNTLPAPEMQPITPGVQVAQNDTLTPPRDKVAQQNLASEKTPFLPVAKSTNGPVLATENSTDVYPIDLSLVQRSSDHPVIQNLPQGTKLIVLTLGPPTAEMAKTYPYLKNVLYVDVKKIVENLGIDNFTEVLNKLRGDSEAIIDFTNLPIKIADDFRRLVIPANRIGLSSSEKLLLTYPDSDSPSQPPALSPVKSQKRGPLSFFDVLRLLEIKDLLKLLIKASPRQSGFDIKEAIEAFPPSGLLTSPESVVISPEVPIVVPPSRFATLPERLVASSAIPIVTPSSESLLEILPTRLLLSLIPLIQGPSSIHPPVGSKDAMNSQQRFQNRAPQPGSLPEVLNEDASAETIPVVVCHDANNLLDIDSIEPGFFDFNITYVVPLDKTVLHGMISFVDHCLLELKESGATGLRKTLQVVTKQIKDLNSDFQSRYKIVEEKIASLKKEIAAFAKREKSNAKRLEEINRNIENYKFESVNEVRETLLLNLSRLQKSLTEQKAELQKQKKEKANEHLQCEKEISELKGRYEHFKQQKDDLYADFLSARKSKTEILFAHNELEKKHGELFQQFRDIFFLQFKLFINQTLNDASALNKEFDLENMESFWPELSRQFEELGILFSEFPNEDTLKQRLKNFAMQKTRELFYLKTPEDAAEKLDNLKSILLLKMDFSLHLELFKHLQRAYTLKNGMTQFTEELENACLKEQDYQKNYLEFLKRKNQEFKQYKLKKRKIHGIKKQLKEESQAIEIVNKSFAHKTELMEKIKKMIKRLENPDEDYPITAELQELLPYLFPHEKVKGLITSLMGQMEQYIQKLKAREQIQKEKVEQKEQKKRVKSQLNNLKLEKENITQTLHEKLTSLEAIKKESTGLLGAIRQMLINLPKFQFHLLYLDEESKKNVGLFEAKTFSDKFYQDVKELEEELSETGRFSLLAVSYQAWQLQENKLSEELPTQDFLLTGSCYSLQAAENRDPRTRKKDQKGLLGRCPKEEKEEEKGK